MRSLNERYADAMDTADAAATVVGRVAALLRALSASEPAGAPTAALARTAGVPRPTAHRLLTDLRRQGLVDRDDGRWLLGPEVFLLGSAASSRYDVSARAQPIVRQLALTTEESAFYSTRRGDETICLVREDGSFPLRSHVLHEGIRFPLGVASAGLVILAFLPDSEVKAFLDRRELLSSYGTGHTREQVWARVQQARVDGFSVNPGLVVEGSWGMGAAVFDGRGAPVGALSLTGVEHRFSPERRRRLGKLLRQSAHALTQGFAEHGAPR
jgi:DNA-binding IclR family transcriptional regulator